MHVERRTNSKCNKLIVFFWDDDQENLDCHGKRRVCGFLPCNRPITDPTRLCYMVPLSAKIVSIFLQETFDQASLFVADVGAKVYIKDNLRDTAFRRVSYCQSEEGLSSHKFHSNPLGKMTRKNCARLLLPSITTSMFKDDLK